MDERLTCAPPGDCTHESFTAEAQVCRHADGEGQPVTGYSVEVRVTCADCSTKFTWLGARWGFGQGGPAGVPRVVGADLHEGARPDGRHTSGGRQHRLVPAMRAGPDCAPERPDGAACGRVTAGGWHGVQGGGTLLEVNEDDVVIVLRACETGHCCGSFHLHGLTMRDLEIGAKPMARLRRNRAASGRALRDADLLIRWLVEDGARPPQFSPDADPMPHFRCAALAGGRCTKYDRRPQLCRDYGARSLCPHPNCTMRVQINPLTVAGAP